MRRDTMSVFSRVLLFTGILCLLGFGGGPERTLAAQIFHSYAKPGPAPEFPLKDLDGKTVNFKDPTGEVMLLNFWATW